MQFRLNSLNSACRLNSLKNYALPERDMEQVRHDSMFRPLHLRKKNKDQEKRGKVLLNID